MTRVNIPNTPEAALAELLPLLKVAHRIYEEVIPQVVEEFTSKKEAIEPFHFASAVRYKARMLFIKNKTPELDYIVLDLLNNGIEVVYKGRNIKFYKGVNGQVPACGQSGSRKAFYQQSLFASIYQDFLAHNLVVIYNVTRDGTFLGLDLASPKGVSSDYEPPQLDWSIPVPHPATMQGMENKYDKKPDDLNEIKRPDEDEGDLDISLDGTDDQ